MVEVYGDKRNVCYMFCYHAVAATTRLHYPKTHGKTGRKTQMPKHELEEIRELLSSVDLSDFFNRVNVDEVLEVFM